YRGVAAEHTDHDAYLTLLGVNFANGAVKALERSVGDVDDFADLEVDLVLWIFYAHALLDLADLSLGNRCRDGAAADESCHARGVSNDIPGGVGQFHLNEHVALEDLLLNNLALAVLDFNLLL